MNQHGDSVKGPLDQPLSQVLESMAASFEARGLSAPMGFGARPALLVIDMQQGFTDAGFPLGSESGETIEVITSLTANARTSQIDVPIVYTVSTWAPESSVWSRKMPAQREILPGSKWAELDPRLGRLSHETVVEKHFASAFFATGLDEHLRRLGVDSVLLAGVTTSGCIRATAVDAVSHGFKVIVAKEAVADRAEATHLMSLFDIHAKYGDVVGVDEVTAHLASLHNG